MYAANWIALDGGGRRKPGDLQVLGLCNIGGELFAHSRDAGAVALQEMEI